MTVHTKSGTEFPDSIDGFGVVEIKSYDINGFNISVGYNSKTEIPIALTHYVYPTYNRGQRISFDEHWDEYKKVIINISKEAIFDSEVETKINDIPSKSVKFSYVGGFARKVQPLHSYFYLFETKDWFIKLRVTFPAEFKEGAEKEISQYLQSLPTPLLKFIH
ncbi:hypothetical protein EHQ76_05670 [Leptospira barantonii]|uniref:DUF1795 domain-containing protein n=1 Tax=Leptospira barantonii TaxID=2023184 RepID=A0A5F2BNI7_9LEPT|nr:hypothetical protein [Leptospira barantonii]TGM07082.1 hypothetical protein EHQ76_05670 [Leptospira barantonii]